MSIFLERFILTVCSAIVVAVLLVNPLKFDIRQRVSLGAAICLFAYFIGHTVKRGSEPAPADADHSAEVEVLKTAMAEKQARIGDLEKQLAASKASAEELNQIKDRQITMLKGDLSRRAADSQVQQKLQNALSDLLAEGKRLRQQWVGRLGNSDNTLQRQSATSVAQWHSKVQTYLASMPRGRAYQARFDIPASQTGVPVGLLLEVGGLWNQLESDLARLNEFIADPDLRLGKP